jgi:hypothetical protein
MPAVESTAARPFRLGCFDVRNGAVFAADDSLPVAAEIDAGSGETVQVFSWPLSPQHRGRPVALDILARDESIMIASPAAGGIVEIDRRSGQATIIPLDADAGTLVASGDAVWAVASPDWSGEPQGGRLDRQRPVVWEEPTGDEIARHQEMTRRFHRVGPLDEEAGRRGMAEWGEAEGDDEDLEPPTPIWSVHGGAGRRIDVDLEQPMLTAAGGKLAGVCRLPSDPIIKHLSPGGGSVSWRYPGSVIVIGDTGTLDVLGAVPGSGGVVCADQGSVWLLGFGEETGEDPAPEVREVREVRVAEGRVSGPLDVRPHHPVAVLDGLVVDVAWPEDGDGPTAGLAGGPAVVRFRTAGGGEPWEVGPADLFRDGMTVVRDGQVWFGHPGGSTLTAAAPGDASLRELRISVDCGPWMPSPQLPAGLDPREFDQAQLDRLRGAFLGGWHTSEGGTEPFIDGVTFDVIELRGDFPDRAVVALFHSEDRPGLQFGRRWRLYDELGNPVDHEYAGIHLMEDVVSGDGGLPPAGDCVPDAGGVVWFEWWGEPGTT